MIQHKSTNLRAGFLIGLSFCGLLLFAGCNKSADQGGPPAAGPPPGMRGPGGPGAVLAADATGAQVYQAKCLGCHGDKGQGVRGPSLQRSSGRPDAQLASVVHDGKGRMPAFGSQLSADQITKVVTYIKTFSAGS